MLWRIILKLRSLITNINEVENKIKERIIAGNKRYHALGHVLKERSTCITLLLRVGLL